jgi:putative PIN family toxin of toxin-antitoxin system
VIRVVLDTSVLVRYLIKPSVAIRELIEGLWLRDDIQVVTSPELIAELEDVLRRDALQRFIQPEEGQVLLDVLRIKAEMLPGLGPVPSFTRDPKDDKFVACALAGEVAYLVTVDSDILILESLGGVQVVTPHELVRTLQDAERTS